MIKTGEDIKMIKKLINRFSVFEIIVISLMTTLGIATKPIIVPLVHIITGPLYISGGAVAGGLYMMWIIVGVGLVRKIGVATLIGLVQAIMIISLGVYGSHGIVSFLTYMLPGVAVDLYILLFRPKKLKVSFFFIAGILANLSGSFLVNIVFFRLPTVPLILTLSAAALSGGLGGIIAYVIIKKLKDNGVIEDMNLRGG